MKTVLKLINAPERVGESFPIRENNRLKTEDHMWSVKPTGQPSRITKIESSHSWIIWPYLIIGYKMELQVLFHRRL